MFGYNLAISDNTQQEAVINDGFLSDFVTFTRASSGTYFDEAGVLQTATTNVARREFDSALSKHGAKCEGARTNSAIYSRDFTNAAWAKVTMTTAKDATGIDGVVSSASTLTAAGADSTILQTVTIGSAAYAFSVYVKRKTGTGTISITDNNGANYTDITSLINSSTFTRVDIVRTQANPIFGFKITTDTDAIEVDFSQLEAGDFDSSPIETTTVATTRAMDVPTVDLTAFDLLPADKGTISCNFALTGEITGEGQHIWNINDGTGTDNIILFKQNGGDLSQGFVEGQGSANGPNITGGGEFKAAIAYKSADNNFYQDGTEVGGVSFKAKVISVSQTTLLLGNSPAGNRPMFGLIFDLPLYPTRLSDAILDGITT